MCDLSNIIQLSSYWGSDALTSLTISLSRSSGRSRSWRGFSLFVGRAEPEFDRSADISVGSLYTLLTVAFACAEVLGWQCLMAKIPSRISGSAGEEEGMSGSEIDEALLPIRVSNLLTHGNSLHHRELIQNCSVAVMVHIRA